MELQFKKNSFSYLQPLLYQVQNQEQTQEIRLSEGFPDIGKILSVWSQPITRTKEWREDTIAFSGGLMIWILYLPEDGSQPRCLESWVPFQMKWELPEYAQNGVMRVRMMPRFLDARVLSARKMMLRCGVSVLAQALTEGEGDRYCADEVPSGIEILRRTYPIVLAKESGEKEFIMDEELTVPPSCPVPEKIIYCNLKPEITEQKILADKAVFRGNGNLHLLYRNEEGALSSWDFQLPFSQLADLRGSYGADASMDVMMEVTNLEVDVTDEGHLRMKCGMVGQYLVRQREMLDVVEDAYCLNRELDITSRQAELPMALENRSENIYADAMIPQEANMIVDCSFLVDQPLQRKTAEGIAMEIPGQFQVLYYDENSMLQSASARWQGEWSMPADENVRVDVDIRPGNAPIAEAETGSISLQGMTRMNVDCGTMQTMRMITGLELGDERKADPSRPSLILRKAGKESLWQIAKENGSTVDAIRQASGIDDEPDQTQILLIPVV